MMDNTGSVILRYGQDNDLKDFEGNWVNLDGSTR